ncbi:MAG: putative deoxyribonuclease YcfH [Verrucomicrobia bacterium ADurb.Bin345]|nr:MAG: putative deoxyribonuclease YcfH [Verrucomicrobia bacterium ADurb.Bin345]
MRLFDAHCHLQDDRLTPHLDGVISRARAAGVERFLCCGSSEADWGHVAKLAERVDGVVPAFGLHPWYLGDRTPGWKQALKDCVERHRGMIGEIGLDHALKDRGDADQESVFLEQLAVARERKLPASIHCRQAWGRMIEVLSDFGPHPPGLVFHAFSGTVELIAKLVELGGYFSFCGTLTYSGNSRAHKSAVAVPEDRLLVETDAPDLPPPEPDVPALGVVNGKAVNEPANLVCVVRKLAELRRCTEEHIADITWRNASNVLQPTRRA